MLLYQFQHFYHEHFPQEMETCVDYFSLFGGLDADFDTDEPMDTLITELVLDNFGYFHNEISLLISLDDLKYHKLLSAIAIGDRRIDSACRHAHMSEAKGREAIDFFCQIGLLNMEYSREQPPQKSHPKQQFKKEIARHHISHKLRFTSPFLRFWFYFIAPNYERIARGNYASVLERFHERQFSFSSFIFEELSTHFLKEKFLNDPLVSLGSYWDRQIELDILAKTKSGNTIVGECKWTNTKINKRELGKLLDKCKTAGINAQTITLFSKRGFSNELLARQSPSLQLFTVDDFSLLLERPVKAKKSFTLSLS